jgi:protein TonB
MKKTLFLVIFTLFCIGNMYAQTYSTDENITESDSTKTTNTEDNEDEYIEQTVVHYQPTYPEFPGGMTELMKFIQENMQYPKIAIKKGIEGRVICQFTVTKDGSIENIIVVRGLHKSLDKEAIRIIKKMPKWKPGEDFNGQTIDCKYTIPVKFKLNKETANP